MKKKLLLLLCAIIGVAACVYFYAYKGHRDIAAETADFSMTVANLQNEFTANDSLAYRKYQDRTIQVSGKISSIDPEEKAIVVDGKLSATFLKPVPGGLDVGSQISIKGRFLGYDDLLEEFKMDQTTVVNKK